MIGYIQKYKKKQGIRYRYTVDLNQDGVRKQKKKSGFLLSSRVITELKEHRRNQEGQKKAAGEMYQDQDLVVCTENGAVQDPGNLLRVTNRIIKQVVYVSFAFTI